MPPAMSRATDESHADPPRPQRPTVHAGHGHRERLRERLLNGGPAALADYELLEYLLFAASARGDTKPQAKALLLRFGSLKDVLHADPAALQQVKGVSKATAAALTAVAAAAHRMAKTEAAKGPILASSTALIDYLRTDMSALKHERVRALFLNARNRLILDHLVSDGTIDEAAIHPREIIRKAFDVGAAALILVHNHPSGEPEPSQADITITRRIAEAGRLMGIAVHDHIIIGAAGHTSLRAKGLF